MYAVMWLNNHKFMELYPHLSLFLVHGDEFTLSNVDNLLASVDNHQADNMYVDEPEVNVGVGQLEAGPDIPISIIIETKSVMEI